MDILLMGGILLIIMVFCIRLITLIPQIITVVSDLVMGKNK